MTIKSVLLASALAAVAAVPAQAMSEMDAPDWPTHLEMIADRPHGLGARVQ